VGLGDAWLAHRNPLRGYLVYSTELLIIFLFKDYVNGIVN